MYKQIFLLFSLKPEGQLKEEIEELTPMFVKIGPKTIKIVQTNHSKFTILAHQLFITSTPLIGIGAFILVHVFVLVLHFYSIPTFLSGFIVHFTFLVLE